MQLRQLREFLERRRWQEVLVVEEGVSGSRRRPERDRLLDAAAAARSWQMGRGGYFQTGEIGPLLRRC